MPRAIVLRAAGTNADIELCRAFTLAGADVDLEHLGHVVGDPGMLGRYDLIAFAGGFSFGDDVASGRIFAARVRHGLWDALRDAAERGCPMIGVCNGFQILVQSGLLPGPRAGERWPRGAVVQDRVALCDNAVPRYHDTWARVEFVEGSRSVWTRDIDRGAPGETLMLPCAHGEGRFTCRSPEVLRELEEAGQVAIRYIDNFNGSEGAVAGICDASGRILGLMPHPERYLDWNRHPFFTRLDAGTRTAPTPGLRMFISAVEAASRAVAV